MGKIKKQILTVGIRQVDVLVITGCSNGADRIQKIIVRKCGYDGFLFRNRIQSGMNHLQESNQPEGKTNI